MISVGWRVRGSDRIHLRFGQVDDRAYQCEQFADERAIALGDATVETDRSQSSSDPAHRTRHGTHPPNRGSEPLAQIAEWNSCSQADAKSWGRSATVEDFAEHFFYRRRPDRDNHQCSFCDCRLHIARNLDARFPAQGLQLFRMTVVYHKFTLIPCQPQSSA